MSRLKLTYFDFPASRGEECRLALSVAGVDFEDERIKIADWPALKPKTPFGSLPILTAQGLGTLSQCNAILVYIGRTYGLHPSDPWQAARHEELLSAAEDLRGKVFSVLSIKGDKEREAVREEMAGGLLQDWGRAVERLLGDGPFVAGDEIHVVDIKLHRIVHWFASGTVDHVPTDVFARFERLTGVYEAVNGHPAVVAWNAR